jgi:hypothetical protein
VRSVRLEMSLATPRRREYLADVVVGEMPSGFLRAAATSPEPVLVFKDVAAGLQSVATAIAFLAGGIWAYYKFFRSRTFRPRLEGEIEAKSTVRATGLLLDVRIRLKNAGLTRLDIIQQGSALRLLSCDEIEPQALYRDVSWKHLSSIEVFKAHEWIEPSESICERVLLHVGDACVAAYKLDLRLVAGTKRAKAPAHRFVDIVLPEPEAAPNGDPARQSGRSAAGLVIGWRNRYREP